MIFLSYPAQHLKSMYLCFEATVISKFSLEIEAREITSEKSMLCPQARLHFKAKQAMKQHTSVTASHQNQAPLDTVYQRAKLGQGQIVQEENAI